MPKITYKQSPFVAVGTYIFAGGFTIGMSRRFRILAHMEDGKFGVSTFKTNYPEIPVVQRENGHWPNDIATPRLEVSHAVPRPQVSHGVSTLKETPKVLDVIYGNPPCSAWSAMGSLADGHAWAKERDWRKARFGCAETFFDVWRTFRPKIWVMESVTQLLTTGKAFVDIVSMEAAKAGYGVWIVLHDPKFMGLPQTRRRVFLIISEIDLVFKPPASDIFGSRPMPRLTPIKDVIKQMPAPSCQLPITGGDLYWWKHAKPGQDFNSAWIRAGRPEGTKPAHRTAHRIDINTPLGTIHSDGHFGHPTEPRYLSAVELAFLSGYPRSYKWPASDARARSEIAKGVTPTAAAWLADCLSTSLINDKTAKPGIVTELCFLSQSPLRGDGDMKCTECKHNIEDSREGK